MNETVHFLAHHGYWLLLAAIRHNHTHPDDI
jgi:hypothetical protein